MVVIMLSDKEVKQIYFKEKKCSNINGFLYRIIKSVDEFDDDLRLNSPLSGNDYERKVCKIIEYLVSLSDGTLAFYRCKEWNNTEYIKEQVGVLPNSSLIDFINGIEWNFFILVDYEAPDKVYGCDLLIEVYDNIVDLGIIRDLEQEDIDDLIEYINNLDIFDITSF